MEDIASMHDLDSQGSSKSTSGATTPENVLGQEASLQRAHSLPNNPRPHARSSPSVPISSPQTKTTTRKRLSLSFPVLPANSSLTPRSSSPTASPICSPTSVPMVDVSTITPDDPMPFLTALAAQERRVLELKEELGKAETELSRLKRQWAVHEATNKLHDITPTSTERLRPLNTSIAAAEGMGSPGREQYQTRKATLSSLNGMGNRKVPSQRHQRTLSLLATNSADRGHTYRQPFPQPAGLDEDHPALVKRHTFATPSSSHSASSSVSSVQSARPPRPHSLIGAPTSSTKRNSQETLLKTGKQMAEVFKDGLWTFIEDIRQATVGDEAINSSVNSTGIRASPHGSAGMVRSPSKTSTRSGSPANGVKHQKEKKQDESLIDFGYDDTKEGLLMDDPSSSSMRWSTSSTVFSDTHSAMISPPTSRSSTPRTSTSSTTSNVPWNQSTMATTLKKTATALVAQVEKSLAPLPATTGSTGYYADGKKGELRARGAKLRVESPAKSRNT